MTTISMNRTRLLEARQKVVDKVAKEIDEESEKQDLGFEGKLMMMAVKVAATEAAGKGFDAGIAYKDATLKPSE